MANFVGTIATSVNGLYRHIHRFGNLADPVFGKRVGDIVGKTSQIRWRILDMRYLGTSVTGIPKVEYLVRPIRLLRRLPGVWVAAENLVRK